MNRKPLFLIVFGMLVISTACAPGQIETLIEDGTNTINEPLASDEMQLLQEGIGPLEITPLPPGENPNLAPSTGLDDGNISSRGEQTTGAASSGEPGMVDSQAPGGLTLEEENQPTVSWLIYQDQDFHFSIAYPDSYTILPAQNSSAAGGPELLHVLRFLDHQLASGDTADFEIPNFTIEVFDLGSLTLENFLDQHIETGNREPVSLGKLNGIRVSLDQLIAPNQFYYFTDQSFVYKLTPLGEYGQQMLESFQIK
jgi:hypothetical protein